MIGPLSGQGGALALLKAAGNGLFQGKRKALVESVLQKLSPEKADELRKKQQDADNLLKQLESSKVDFNTRRKSAAAEKVQQIKQKLQMLRLLASVNPEAAARQAAQLARELAQAAREYASASGGMTMAAAATVPVAGGQEGAADVAATAESVDAVPVAGLQTETAGEEETSARQGQGDPMAKFQEDSEFAKAVEEAKTALKRIIEEAKRKLRENGDDSSAGQDIRNAENALRQASMAMAGIAAGAVSILV